MKWRLLSDRVPQDLAELKAILLQNRGITDESSFFSPPNPLSFTLEQVGIDRTQMEKTLERLTKARDNKEDVLIFGDYDADGICATAILWEGLRAFGIVARPFIPHREKHGYGLSARSLEAVLSEKKPDLLITVDNGIVAHDAFAQLKKEGIDAILTDHHQPEVDSTGKVLYPPAITVVHTTQLCGATVAWMLSRELNREAAEKSLDLTAIATIADQMSLLGVCRSFVVHGMKALRQTERVGLQLLCAKATVECKDLAVGDVNFVIAPRINAMGRIKHGLDALRLICTKSMERAEELVYELNDTNTSRQELTNEMVEHAMRQAHEWDDEHIIVVASPDYHEGVIGLIAGKLAESFSKPAIVVSLGEKVAKASARSISGINIIELIRQVKDDLLEAGGHPMAAGFGMLPEKLEIVKKRLQKIAREQITEEMLVPTVDVDCLLPLDFLHLETIDLLDIFAPFGQGNREPVFGLEGMQIVGTQLIGRESKHLKAIVTPVTDLAESLTYVEFTAMGWRLGHLHSQMTTGLEVNLAVNLQRNEWRGKQSLQLVIKDIAVL